VLDNGPKLREAAHACARRAQGGTAQVSGPQVRPGEALGDGGGAPSLRHRAVTGVALTLAQNIIGRASLFLGQLALARILMPADFGAIALASTITTISQALVFFGIDQILQQRKQNARLWATQVFALSLGFAVAGALLMVLAGFVGAAVFHDRQLPAMMAINAVATVLCSLWTVPQAALQWRLRFKFLTAYCTFDAVLSQVLIVVAALAGLGAFSFFAPLILTNLLRVVVYWRAAGVQLRPLRRAHGWSLIIRRGLSALATRIAYVIISQGDFLILALLATRSVVGAYFFAFRLASQPMTLLSGSITGVLFSSLLKVPDRERRGAIAFQAAEVIGAITVPVCLMVAVAAGPGVVLLFGARWKEATPLVQILSVGLPFDAMSWPAGALLLANGEFRRSFFYQSWSLPLFLALVIAGAFKAQALGVASGVAAYYVIHSLAYTVATFRRTGVGAPAAALLFAKLFLCAAVGFGPAYLFVSSPFLSHDVVGQLAVALILAPALYVGALFVLARAIFESIVRQGFAFLHRFAPGLQIAAFRWRPAP
jgi:PST family polysaccharide transporter